MESFTFDAFHIRDEAPAEFPLLSTLREAAVTAGWQPEDADGDLGRKREHDAFAVRNAGLQGHVRRSAADGVWSVSVVDSDLGWATGYPNRAAQSYVLDLLRELLLAAPPYVGVARWPAGAADAERYDSSTPFALRQVGSVMFLSARYLAAHPPRDGLDSAPVRIRLELAGGWLLVVGGSLLRSARYGHLDELRAFFDLPATPIPTEF
jgi:hypothetical protein